MTPYNYSVPVYYYIPIPADDKGSDLTGPEFVGLIVGLIIFCVWLIAVGLVIDQLILDSLDTDNKQEKKRHKIELIVLIAIGVIWLIMC